jgi:DNA-binding Xre family transcriptional regulator
MHTFKPFFDTLERKGITQYSLINDYGVSSGLLSRMRVDGNVNIDSIDDLCDLLECEYTDVVQYKKKPKDDSNK